MAKIGLNHRLSVAKTLKEQTRTLYEGMRPSHPEYPTPEWVSFQLATRSVLHWR
jgi:hypothetical protein